MSTRSALAVLLVAGAADRAVAGSVVIEERAIDVIDDNMTTDDPATPPKPPPDEVQYRFAVMMSDAAALGLTIGGYKVFRAYEDCECEEFASGYLVMFGVATYLAGPPSIHYQHDRVGRTVASVAARVALPATALAIARGSDLDSRDTAVLVATSVVGAMVFDWLVLARD